MDILQGNKFTSYAEDDSISPDSLSFSGLVCIQNQQPKLPSPNHAKHHNQVSKNDPEFEFTSTKAYLNSAVNPIKTKPADMLISNGQLQLQPQAHAFQTNQSLIRSAFRPSPATRNIRKMSSGKTGRANGSHEKHDKASQSTDMESTAKRAQLGQKMKCFISPCRNSKAITPGAVKAQTAPRPRESFNLFLRDQKMSSGI
ncbi:hypothetical protein RIF29_41340 [Crotalaria pallida]|uniref:Uncharacterized protein n=1 Tax=Crotalaria pallida TaxID=3830 RepID=A0AAN9EB24_CROPI